MAITPRCIECNSLKTVAVSKFAVWLQRRWYEGPAPWFLLPLTGLYRSIIACRRSLYRLGLKHTYVSSVPVIVVGNITVGGTGKTPVVSWLVEQLRAYGYTPGVVSRGYGVALRAPTSVGINSSASEVGDEPSMLQAICGGVPMVVYPKRGAAIEHLKQQYPNVDVVVCDDGLQHYALARDIELVVVDVQRQFGNEWCLPSGPLREPISRLKHVDALIVNGGCLDETPAPAYTMQLNLSEAINVITGEAKPLKDFTNIVAVAGIGNPQRFFTALASFTDVSSEITFPDHHTFEPNDFSGLVGDVLMTQKDAVKCAALPLQEHAANFWYVPVTVDLEQALIEQIIKKLKDER